MLRFLIARGDRRFYRTSPRPEKQKGIRCVIGYVSTKFHIADAEDELTRRDLNHKHFGNIVQGIYELLPDSGIVFLQDLIIAGCLSAYKIPVDPEAANMLFAENGDSKRRSMNCYLYDEDFPAGAISVAVRNFEVWKDFEDSMALVDKKGAKKLRGALCYLFKHGRRKGEILRAKNFKLEDGKVLQDPMVGSGA